MERKYYIKIITGFREDQQVSIPMQEAHKAYYLFTHPDERGVFDNGVALVGRNIQEIRPDWNATMGWLETHTLDGDDLIEIRRTGVESKMRMLIERAKDVGAEIQTNKELAKMNLGEILETQKSQNMLEN